MRKNTLKNRVLAAAMILIMVIAALGLTTMTNGAAYAAEKNITVNVTVSHAGTLAEDAEGNVMVNMPVTVAADESGLATVDAVLTAFHEKYFPGGYATTETSFGLSVSKLWGVENGGSYLFAIDKIMCNSGVGYDYVGDGQTLTAIVMKDLVYWSDLYAFFDQNAVTAKVGEAVELTLAYDAVTYDADWNPSHVATPIEGADVFVAGAEDTVLATTDAEGKASVSFEEAGTYIVTSAGAVAMQVQDWSQGGIFVDAEAPFSAPACVITVEAEDEPVVDEPTVDEPAVDPEEPKDEPVDEPAATPEEPKDEPAVEDEPVAEDGEEAEKAPATGDTAQMAVYLVMMMAAATAFVAKKQH